jgi:hypothetical protein
MRIQRRFVWSDERADDYEELLSPGVDRHLIHDGVPFRLRHWDMRYVGGKPRITEAVYEQAAQGTLRARSA